MWWLKFCSAAISTCNRKPLERFLENNYHQRRKTPGNCFNCFASFLPSTAGVDRLPPSNTPVHALKKAALQVLHMTEFPLLVPLHWVLEAWAVLPLHTQAATAAPWQTPKSTSCPSHADFLHNC